MKRVSPVLAVLLMASFTEGCATAASASACRPGESTVTCCIKKFPLSPVESCGATEAEALKTLARLSVANEVFERAEEEEEDEFANNEPLPEWKQRCIKAYVDCKNEGWVGNCYDCIRYCEGQRVWPVNKCKPRKKR